MKRSLESQFFRFLETELMLSSDAIALAIENHREDLRLLPITLWKYQLITINQLGALFDWFDNAQERLVL
jgi:hypothetical protein